LKAEIGREIGKVLMAGSSAGGYLALATAATIQKQPSALLLLYGMLDPSNKQYLTPGIGLFGQPSLADTNSILKEYPKSKENDERTAYAGLPLQDFSVDPRFKLIAALHSDALFPDYLTGVDSLAKSIAAIGAEAIPRAQRNLFPLDFGNLGHLAPTFLLHGKNDSAVPVALSERAEKRLQEAGVQVYSNFPDDAEHGFDSGTGNASVEESPNVENAGFQSLRNAIDFLDKFGK
jgi:acetyl esterase/lipase